MRKAALFGAASCILLIIPFNYSGQIPLSPAIYFSRGHYGDFLVKTDVTEKQIRVKTDSGNISLFGICKDH